MWLKLLYLYTFFSTGLYALSDNYLYMISHVCKRGEYRRPDYPFVTGDTFRYYAEHVYDETSTTFNPEKVLEGDIVFVNTYLLFNFFIDEHPRIKHRYVLITHNSDFYSPGEFTNYLEDPKIFAWFGCNPNVSHPKFKALPLGIINKWARPSYYLEEFDRIRATSKKNNLCYSNFSMGTNYNIRKMASDCFATKSFVVNSGHCTPREYLIAIANSKYTISPPGRGLDCYRVWESVYLNTIPVVLSSPADELYQDLPILIIDQWEQVTQEFLENNYAIMQSNKNTYNYEKSRFPYWWNQIKQSQMDCRAVNL